MWFAKKMFFEHISTNSTIFHRILYKRSQALYVGFEILIFLLKLLKHFELLLKTFKLLLFPLYLVFELAQLVFIELSLFLLQISLNKNLLILHVDILKLVLKLFNLLKVQIRVIFLLFKFSIELTLTLFPLLSFLHKHHLFLFQSLNLLTMQFAVRQTLS